MGVDVRHATADDLERWDELVERSPQGTPFHLYGFLEALEAHTKSTLHPLIGYKGQEPVGLFPGFEISQGPISMLFSPPPSTKIAYLGPILVNQRKLKRRKAERDHRQFIEGCFEAFNREMSPKYIHVRTGPRYVDVRPFIWDDFETTLGYTYVVDLEIGEDALLESFSSDARKNIQSVEESGYLVRDGGFEAIEPIITQLEDRHREQGEHYGVTADLVVSAFERLPPGTIRPYECTLDGEFVGGMIALELGDTTYRWQGGAKTDTDLSVNDYIDWTVMREAMGRGGTRYDMVGATNERLTGYKAKFNPTLEPNLSVYKGTRSMSIASDIYKRLR